jgi:hypothetical protein
MFCIKTYNVMNENKRYGYKAYTKNINSDEFRQDPIE